jgi:hypothetical protein
LAGLLLYVEGLPLLLVISLLLSIPRCTQWHEKCDLNSTADFIGGTRSMWLVSCGRPFNKNRKHYYKKPALNFSVTWEAHLDMLKS